MAFVTGTAADQAALKAALIAACTANGFTFTNAILRKGDLFVRPWLNATLGWGNHLFLEIGKSCDVPEAAIVNSLGASVGPGGCTLLQPAAYPVTYDIHVIGDEVFMIYWDTSDRHFWVAFGQSSPFSATPGAGNNLWAGGTQTSQINVGAGSVNPDTGMSGDTRPIAIGPKVGGCKSTFAGDYARVSAALFWSDEHAGTGTEPACVYTDGAGAVNGGRTLGSSPSTTFEVSAVRHLAPLMERLASAWNLNNPLLPIQLTTPIPATTNRKMDIQVANAWYYRLDHVAPRSLITVNGQQYKVYPWFKRNVNARNASENDLENVVDHTGTFGWAIKYTGP